MRSPRDSIVEDTTTDHVPIRESKHASVHLPRYGRVGSGCNLAKGNLDRRKMTGQGGRTFGSEESRRASTQCERPYLIGDVMRMRMRSDLRRWGTYPGRLVLKNWLHFATVPVVREPCTGQDYKPWFAPSTRTHTTNRVTACCDKSTTGQVERHAHCDRGVEVRPCIIRRARWQIS